MCALLLSQFLLPGLEKQNIYPDRNASNMISCIAHLLQKFCLTDVRILALNRACSRSKYKKKKKKEKINKIKCEAYSS
jgi:hypothetical protein